MYRRLLLPLVVLVLAATGCGGDDASSTTPDPLSTDELTWVRAYAAWSIDAYDEELGPPPGGALVRECTRRVDAMGDPPTKRLEPAATRMDEVCPLLGDAGMYRRGLHVIDVVDDMLRPFLLESQDLPLASRVTNRSRADTRLSALASHMADTPVEVRCWSDADFKRVIGEKNAWTDDDEDADDLYGWLDEDNSRIHMLVSQCNTLVSIRSKDVQSWSEESQIDAADSLDTLAHEIQHFVLPDAGEADVECAAFKKISTIARRLGANSAEAALLARLYRSEVYPNAPDEYRKPSGCG